MPVSDRERCEETYDLAAGECCGNCSYWGFETKTWANTCSVGPAIVNPAQAARCVCFKNKEDGHGEG